MKKRAHIALLTALMILAGLGSALAVEYEVKKGDTLSRIARRELGDGNRWREIAEINNIDPPYRIVVGQKLDLPPGEDAVVSSRVMRLVERVSERPLPDRQTLILIAVGTVLLCGC
jgi:LysM repeat protein